VPQARYRENLEETCIFEAKNAKRSRPGVSSRGDAYLAV
jgi:hypothetical protein